MFIQTKRVSHNGLFRHISSIVTDLAILMEQYDIEEYVSCVELIAGAGQYTDEQVSGDEYYLVLFKNEFGGIIRPPDYPFLYIVALHDDTYSFVQCDKQYKPEQLRVH